MVGISKDNNDNSDSSDTKKRYKCISCPYVSNSKSQFYYHKQFHRPRGAQFKCNICSYNVTRRHLLHQHLKIHGISVKKILSQDDDLKKSYLDAAPLVWVQFENQFLKMYKCRQCPQTSLQQLTIDDHEKLHQNFNNVEHQCSDCSFGTNDSDELATHLKYHNDTFGTVHCLVDEEKTDEEQISQLTKILGPLTPVEQLSPETILLEKDVDEKDEKSIYFCDNCPARFLHVKEFTIHMKFHNSNLAFRCPCCNYTSRQQSYLISHLKVHTEEYQEKTKILQTIYPTSAGHKCPRTAILMDVPEINGPAWIVVSMNSPPKSKTSSETDDNTENVIPKKYYRCEQCPAKFYKFAALKYHKKLHGSNNAFKCNSCNYAAKTEVSFLKHQSDHDHIDSDPETSEPTSSVPSKIDRTSSSETNISIADVSSLYVDSQFGILMHGSPEFIYPTYVKNGRVKQKRYKCHKCPSAFEKREQYKNHLTLHGSQQKYRCKQCDYSVKYYANYVQHVRKHQMNADAHAAKLKSRQNSSTTDEQSDENIESINNSINHLSAPTTAEVSPPLKISVADRQALMILQQRRSREEKLKETGDERKLYSCPNCPYANSRRDSIDNHVKRHISISGFTSNFTCNYCDYSVPQCHFLRDHVKLHFLPMKTNKLELYMMCDKLQIWSQQVPKNIPDNNVENESQPAIIEKQLVFQNDSNAKHDNAESYKPPLDENSNDSDCNDNMEDCILINSLTGEVVIESNEAKDIVISNPE